MALAFGAYAADDKQAKADAEPGFNNLDTNDDGKLTRAEKKALKNKANAEAFNALSVDDAPPAPTPEASPDAPEQRIEPEAAESRPNPSVSLADLEKLEFEEVVKN